MVNNEFMNYNECLVDFLSNFDKYVNTKYVLNKNMYTRSGGKWSLDTAIKYPICSNKKTKFRDANHFLKIQTGDINMNITGSGVCDRMQYIDPQAYRDMTNDSISAIYESIDVPKFKGFIIAGIDSSIIDIPNRPETRKEMGIPEDTKFKKYSAVARLSCMIDGKSDFILSSNLSNEFTDEITHALWHLNDVKNRINLQQTIITFDRFYNSKELMLSIMQLNSFFIIRGKTSTFKKQQEIMKRNNKTDSIFEINLTDSLINTFRDPKLQKYAKEMGKMPIRIVKVPLKTGEEEILFTNVPKEIATPTELKELYGDRWTTEKDFDRLKNKLYIEKFTGRRKIIIEQDCYSHIFLFNLLMGLKNDADAKITRKPRKTAQYKYEYHTNINVLIGEIKEYLPYLLTNDQKQINQITEKIMETATKELVATKIPTPTNAERENKYFKPTNCPSNSSQGF
jgi:hypothetical protein